MTFAGEKSRSRIEPDPAGARKIDLRPGVQIGKVALGPRRTVERLLVGGELYQVPRREARGKSEIAQDLHQQPA